MLGWRVVSGEWERRGHRAGVDTGRGECYGGETTSFIVARVLKLFPNQSVLAYLCILQIMKR